MNNSFLFGATVGLAMSLAAVTGCTPKDGVESTYSTTSATGPVELNAPLLANEHHDHGHHDHGEHDHGHEGPHGGHLIELGKKHEYHAELVENTDSQTVSVYILDDLFEEVTIEAESITLLLNVDNSITNFELVAATRGHSSRFDGRDKESYRILNQHGHVKAKLRVMINGKPFVGRLTHKHHVHDHFHR